MTVPRLTPLAFADLDGWAGDAHAEAFATFRRSALRMADHPPRTRALGIDGTLLADVSREALTLPPDPGDTAARAFFERRFRPARVEAGADGAFLTGYFEPDIAGSRVRTPTFAVPLLARPADLTDVSDANRPLGWDPSCAFARRTAQGLVPYFSRAEIETGALDGQGLELVFVADPVEAFFIHVQGSCRVRLPDGHVLRLTYDGKAGHPYTSIGKALVARGVGTAESMTADMLKAWLRANPDAGRDLMRENKSYIFFKPLDGLDPSLGAVAAAGVQLTPGRSLAVDRTLHTFGTPVWIEGDLPAPPEGAMAPVRRLMVAQDTGSAIVGPARGDVFVGSGISAGEVAGRIRHVPRQFVVFVPHPNRR